VIKRLVIPVKSSITVLAGTGFHVIENLAGGLTGAITYIVIEGVGGSKGRIKVRDIDNAQDIFRDPRVTPLIGLDFYVQTVKIPINGTYHLILDSVNTDGSYTVYYVLEERPTRV
jgi:hypothetical protein